MLIIQNWDDVAPVIKAAWVEVDKVAQAFGGWETVLGGVGLYMTRRIHGLKALGTLRTALTLATQLSGVLGKIATLGATTVQIAVAIYMFEQLKEIADAAKERIKQILSGSLLKTAGILVAGITTSKIAKW